MSTMQVGHGSMVNTPIGQIKREKELMGGRNEHGRKGGTRGQPVHHK